MTTADTIAILFGISSAILGISSIVVSIVGINISRQSKKLTELQADIARRQKNLEEGNSEWELFKAISDARCNFESNSIRAIELKCNFRLSGKLNDAMVKDIDNAIEYLVRSSLENYLNSYEEACTKYLDDKIDKERFKISYQRDIDGLFKMHKPYFEADTRFHAIKHVHGEWTNPTKSGS